jgi:spermidine synthase
MKDDDPDKHKWFRDHISPNLIMCHSVKGVIYSGHTKYQSVEILDTGSFGTCFVLDGKIQSSESDEFIYHETLVHPAMLAHPHPRQVFIAGGGEGAALREVMAHKTVKRAVLVDIDEEAVNICRRFLPAFHQNSFDDPRAELHFTDARKYLVESSDKFDVIIIDVTDPLAQGPARFLYTKEFYQTVKQRLEIHGIISVQAEPAGWGDLQNFVAIVSTLRSVFSIVCPCQVYIPSFSTPWGFVCASESLDPAKLTSEEIDDRLSTRVSKQLRSYDGLTHRAAFTIPKHIRRQLATAQRIITDNEPISVY